MLTGMLKKALIPYDTGNKNLVDYHYCFMCMIFVINVPKSLIYKDISINIHLINTVYFDLNI